MAGQHDEYPHQSAGILGSLWRNWAIAFGALIVPVLAALLVPRLWIPFICLIEVWGLISIGKAHHSLFDNACPMLLKIAAQILIFTAFIMLGIYLLCTDWVLPTVITFHLYNSEIPFVTCLVIFPTTLAVGLIWLFGGLADNFCRKCQRLNGYYAGDSIVATLYYRESRYQIRILTILAAVIGAVEYWYYFARYINSDLNNPDRFFFNYIPIAMYLLSLFFMGGRYTSMRALYEAVESNHDSHRNRTVVRYLIFCLDELLLHQSSDSTWDTPAETTVGRTASLPAHRAEQIFKDIRGATAPALRYCFTNEGFATGSNIIHYAVFVDPEQKAQFAADDSTWFNPYMLDTALSASALAPVLANELYRIHTMAMAWKTYDRQGHRLYPIRHYRPTFKLRDLREWTIDFDDQTWFDVANNNEDRYFYRLRHLWNRLTNVFRPRRA